MGHVVGTIFTADKDRLKKILFRVSRGNALVSYKDIERPFKNSEGKFELKSVYFIVFEEGEVIRDKIGRVCDSFLGKRFDMPLESLQAAIVDTQRKLTDTRDLI